jgi:hypothetical protein
VALTQHTGRINEDLITSVFEQLPAVTPESLLGEWRGNDFDTGHPGVQKNKELRWAGKSFVSVDDVKPMMVYDDAGRRVWNEQIGGARVSLILRCWLACSNKKIWHLAPRGEIQRGCFGGYDLQ